MLSRFIVLVMALATFREAAAQEPRPKVDLVMNVPVPVSHFRARADGFSQYSGMSDSGRVVIRDAAAWQSYWTAIHRPFIPAPPVPEVDFTREMILLASMGARPTGGHGIRIERAAVDSARLVVVVRQTLPGNGCALAATMTQPVDLARIPSTPLPVAFVERTERTDCPATPALHRP